AARVRCRRLAPWSLGSSPIGLRPLVARTTRSRFAPSARPVISSATPCWYTSAVSTKLPPASRKASTIARDAASWASLPKVIVPRHSPLTLTPVRPSSRISMLTPPARDVDSAPKSCCPPFASIRMLLYTLRPPDPAYSWRHQHGDQNGRALDARR